VSKPWGDSERYDFAVDAGRRMLRVQVKSTQYVAPERLGFVINMARRAVLYTEEDIDFVAVYIVPLNLWYIIPIKACLNRSNLLFYPESKNSRGRYEKYREAWWRLRSAESSKPRLARRQCRRERSRSCWPRPILLRIDRKYEALLLDQERERVQHLATSRKRLSRNAQVTMNPCSA